MKKTRLKRSLSLILCIVLIAAMALMTTGGNDNNGTDPGLSAGEQQQATTVGKGETQFTFTVTDRDGNETVFDVHTDKTVVGDALLELNLIAGEESQYGLFVKTVNGITADFNVDGKYWAFYENGKYASAGVDTTEIVEGATYSFKVER